MPALDELKRAGVPVLWSMLDSSIGMTPSLGLKPLSWWSAALGSFGTKRLLQITHDYLVDTRGLDNLIWEWSVHEYWDTVGAGGLSDFYPGDAYVDVVACWAIDRGVPEIADYQALRSLGKPLALANNEEVPTVTELAAQPDWAYFTVRSLALADPAVLAAARETFASSRALNQGQIPVPGRVVDR